MQIKKTKIKQLFQLFLEGESFWSQETKNRIYCKII